MWVPWHLLTQVTASVEQGLQGALKSRCCSGRFCSQSNYQLHLELVALPTLLELSICSA